MYAPFAVIFPEESSRHQLAFRLSARNLFGLGAGNYELYDIYPALQEAPLFEIFLNVTNDENEVLATLFCQINPQEHEINLSLSEIHLQRPSALALLAAVEAQFNHSRGEQWAQILLERAERMQKAFLKTVPDAEIPTNTHDVRLLRDDALQMLLSHSDDPMQQEVLIDALLQEMRQVMLSELESHRTSQAPQPPGKIIQFPGRRWQDWQAVPWLDLQVALRDLPEIWRRITVPDCLTLTQLHRILQMTMGWQDRQAWHFVYAQDKFISQDGSVSLWDTRNADTATLAEQLPRKGAQIEYTYGENWTHTLRVMQRHRPGKGDFQLDCLDGAMACPPEEVGGPEGYRHLQHVLLKKRHSRADKLLLAELAGYDIQRFEREAVHQLLASLAGEFGA